METLFVLPLGNEITFHRRVRGRAANSGDHFDSEMNFPLLSVANRHCCRRVGSQLQKQWLFAQRSTIDFGLMVIIEHACDFYTYGVRATPSGSLQ